MKIRTVIVALGLIVLGAPAFAQTPPTADEAKKDVDASKKDPLMIQQSSPVDWMRIKGHEKGYIMKTEAPANSWLATNFKACDADSNDQVSKAEYEKCRKIGKQ